MKRAGEEEKKPFGIYARTIEQVDSSLICNGNFSILLDITECTPGWQLDSAQLCSCALVLLFKDNDFLHSNFALKLSVLIAESASKLSLNNCMNSNHSRGAGCC